MDKNLHDIDEIFRRALQQYDDEAPVCSWEKISAILDRDDAHKYRKRSIGWRRIAIILLLLLSGLMIYESLKVTKKSRLEKDIAQELKYGDSLIINDEQGEDKNANGRNIEISNEGENSSVIPDRPYNENSNLAHQEKTELSSAENGDRSVFDKIEKIVLEKEEALLIQKSGYHEKFKRLNRRQVLSQKEKKDNIASQKRKATSLQANYFFLTSDSSKQVTIQKEFILAKIDALPVIKLTEFSGVRPSFVPKNIFNSFTVKKGSAINFKRPELAFKPYWYITAFASSDWSQYNLDNDVEDNNGNNQDEREEINNREKHEPSFSAGFFATRQFSKNWGLKTGLIFSSTVISIDPQELYASQTNNGTVAYKYITSSGYGYVKPGFGLPPAIGDSIQSTEAQHNLQSISLPLMFTGKYEKKKLAIIPAAGVSINFITNATVKTEVKDALNKETVSISGLNGMKSFYLGLIADVNFMYSVNDRWSVSILPAFKYAVSPITKSNVVKTYPYSAGIGAGLVYKF